MKYEKMFFIQEATFEAVTRASNNAFYYFFETKMQCKHKICLQTN